MPTSQTTDLKSSALPSTKLQTSSHIQSASKKAVSITSSITSNKACSPETNAENTAPDRTKPFAAAGVSCAGPLTAEMATGQTTDVNSGALPSTKPQTASIEVAGITCNQKYQPETNAAEMPTSQTTDLKPSAPTTYFWRSQLDERIHNQLFTIVQKKKKFKQNSGGDVGLNVKTAEFSKKEAKVSDDFFYMV